ncbi:MAG: hypothetical protein HYT80_11070 [Euryarchaeota archaeon]|nr:hypothetical protein [Euryarchaeota archaeon]
MAGHPRVLALVSLAAFVAALGASWDWFDVDEFANIQQAQRANDGLDLYTRTPSNHPPLYTEPVLRALLAIPGSDLLAARLGNVLLVWGAGLLFVDLYRRAGHPGRAALFLTVWSLNGFLLLGATRAMNETLVLFLLSLAFWITQRGLPAWASGAATSLAGLSRLTTVFFAPALLLADHRRAGKFFLGGAAAGVGLLIVYALVHPGFFDGFVRWAVVFHTARAPEEWSRKIGKALWWSGVPLLAFLAWRHRPLLRRESPAEIAAWTAAGCSLLLGRRGDGGRPRRGTHPGAPPFGPHCNGDAFSGPVLRPDDAAQRPRPGRGRRGLGVGEHAARLLRPHGRSRVRGPRWTGQRRRLLLVPSRPDRP